eukprot:3092048-Rhodomonas_salina.1
MVRLVRGTDLAYGTAGVWYWARVWCVWCMWCAVLSSRMVRLLCGTELAYAAPSSASATRTRTPLSRLAKVTYSICLRPISLRSRDLSAFAHVTYQPTPALRHVWYCRSERDIWY